MKNRFAGENIVAVTGGTTLEAVAEMMTPDSKNRKLLFVPARGGLGEKRQESGQYDLRPYG